jgi:CBS domain-containing protein
VTRINILFFLTPKADVAFLERDFSLRQVLEKMEHYHYAAIPILDSAGEYIGTLTEGDILWYCRHNGIGKLKQTESLNLMDLPRRHDYVTVNASSNMESLLSKAMQQNFVPVVDDCDKFIGIIKRSDIIQYYYDRM